MNTLDPLLRFKLDPIVRRQRRIQLSLRLTLCWLIIAILGLGLISLQKDSGWSSAASLPLLIATGGVAALVIIRRQRRSEPNWRGIARMIEARHPELKGLVLTAVEQEPKDGELTFLQDRLVQEAVQHSERSNWAAVVPFHRLALSRLANLAAFGLFIFVLTHLKTTSSRPFVKSPFTETVTENGVTVSPGDASIERGTSLVIMSRFVGPVPAKVDLVIESLGEPARRIPLVKSLADPMFGGSVPEVLSNLTYRIEYGSQRTRDFKVTVFEYPKLLRPDAEVTYPSYTGLDPKRIENTRRISAVEGSQLDLTLQLNKPVVSARLIARDSATNSITLTLQSNVPVALLKRLPLDTSRTYQLHLVDSDGRTNKVPTQFVFDALKNKSPELKLVTPRGDIAPSSLEEVVYDGTVWDDFGVKAFGLAYIVGGQDPKFIELGQTIAAKEKHPFKHVLALEEMAVKPDDLISYFLWADDIGPDGQLRRTTGDLYFAEVRPFEEVFRERQGGGEQGGEQDQQGGEQQGGQQGRQGRLVDLQKQIISATWKLQRQSGLGTPKPADTGKAPRSSFIRPIQTQFLAQRAGGPRGAGQRGARGGQNSPQSNDKPASPEQFKEDATVVRDSQAQALEQAQGEQENQSDARQAALWEAATKSMERAIEKLNEALNKPETLPDALAAEQAAYQTLLKLQQRQFEVSRQRGQRGQQGQNARQQQRQRQLDQLDLTEQQNRYETQNQARSPQNQSPERQEQLQIQNRLAELARRQQDLNERMREMQTALQEARTEQQREELRRQLKRLQEEQQQMVADSDELAQRMDRQQDQSRQAEQRQQLDQARQDMQNAASAAEQGNPSQALASGTRAQRQMQDMRDEMRRQNSSEFSEDLRQMRADARDLARRQQDVERDLAALDDPKRRTLSDEDLRKELLNQLAQQRERLTNLVDRATQLSEQTEASEPLASKELYDTLRKFSTDDSFTVRQLRQTMLTNGVLTYSMEARLRQLEERPNGGRALDATSDLLRADLPRQAQQAQSSARTSIEDFRRGIENAAEKVIGDDSEALRLAQEQLDQLTNQLNREMAQATGRGTNEQAQAQGSPGEPGQQGRGGRQPGEQAQSGDRGQRGATELAQSEQPGEGQPGERGQQGQQGRQGQRGQGRGEQAQGEQGQGEQAQAEGQGQGQGQGQGRGQQARAGNRGQGARGGQPEGGQGQEGQPDDSGQLAQQDAQEGNQPGGNRAGQRGGQPGARDGNPQDRQLAGGNRTGARQPGGGRNGTRYGGDANIGGGWDLNRFLENDFTAPRQDFTGPVLTGNEFANWSDQLREVEELVDDPYLQNRIAQARERARMMRQEFRNESKKPDWAVVQLQVVKPLADVRDAIADELARRGPKDNLVPIDRDPVPTRYSELVRRYYEELGKEK